MLQNRGEGALRTTERTMRGGEDAEAHAQHEANGRRTRGREGKGGEVKGTTRTSSSTSQQGQTEVRKRENEIKKKKKRDRLFYLARDMWHGCLCCLFLLFARMGLLFAVFFYY